MIGCGGIMLNDRWFKVMVIGLSVVLMWVMFGLFGVGFGVVLLFLFNVLCFGIFGFFVIVWFGVIG